MIESTHEVDDRLAAADAALSACAEGGLRINGPFPARVKGPGADGVRFVADATIENLSAHDCCVRLAERVEKGGRLNVAARINRAVVSLRGPVLHASRHADGTWGATIRITRYRFIRRRENASVIQPELN